MLIKYSTEPPFDRHDWFVQREYNGQKKEVRYVIDYYSGDPEPTGEPVFYLDVRPAVTPTAAVERMMRWGGDVWFRASGAKLREHQANWRDINFPQPLPDLYAFLYTVQMGYDLLFKTVSYSGPVTQFCISLSWVRCLDGKCFSLAPLFSTTVYYLRYQVTTFTYSIFCRLLLPYSIHCIPPFSSSYLGTLPTSFLSSRDHSDR